MNAKQNQTPQSKKSLNSFQNRLSNAAFVLEILQQHEKSDDLLDANLEILGMASHQSLKKTLDRVCKTACSISQADWAIVHPFMAGKKPNQIDQKNIGHYGELQKVSTANLTNGKIHIGDVSKYVLQKGALIVENIDNHEFKNGKPRLAEHHFIKAEGVKALIGMSIMDPYSKDLLGILYLDYRKPRKFSKSDVHHAKSLVNLAGVAISNTYEMDEVKQRRQFKLASEIAEAVGTSLDLQTTIDAILGKLHEAFGKARLCVLLYDKRLHALKFAPAALKYYGINIRKRARQSVFPLDGNTIACRVAKRAVAEKTLAWENVKDVSKDGDYLKFNPRVKSEFCISLLNTRNEMLGVLVLEKEQINGFSHNDMEIIKTVAQHISIAIERAQQGEELEYKSIVATRTSWAANIAHGINSEVNNVLTWAYLIRKKAGGDTEIGGYAKNIEESVAQLVSINPWTNKPPEPVVIDPLLLEDLSEIARPKGIHVDFDLNTPRVRIMIKIAQFKNILRLLINNAAKAMSQTDEKKILVSTRLINNNAAVEILFQDFGPGISEEKHPLAFHRPFTTKETGGYGLLFIRQMIEDMHGEITLLPYQQEKGAGFLIHLPVSTLDQGVQHAY